MLTDAALIAQAGHSAQPGHTDQPGHIAEAGRTGFSADAAAAATSTPTSQEPPMEHEPYAHPPMTDSVPAGLSAMACQVCGHHALHAEELGNGIARGLSARLICRICGAHRVIKP